MSEEKKPVEQRNLSEDALYARLNEELDSIALGIRNLSMLANDTIDAKLDRDISDHVTAAVGALSAASGYLETINGEDGKLLSFDRRCMEITFKDKDDYEDYRERYYNDMEKDLEMGEMVVEYEKDHDYPDYIADDDDDYDDDIDEDYDGYNDTEEDD